MAFNNGFPVNYQQMYYPQQYQMPVMQNSPTQPAQQIQGQHQQQTMQAQYPVIQGGFVRVMNENEARMYPVAPGNSVTFIDENAPYCYTKTVDMSQLDRPKFERYRLVKEESPSQPVEAPSQAAQQPAVDFTQFALAADLEAFKAELEAIKGDLYGLAGKKKSSTKKEVVADE